jgi:ABC-2 type transport system permease protein
LRFFIRISAFFRKEIVAILRQPRLILTLVLGPFLILLAFGLGYSNEAQPLRTLFVLPPDDPLEAYVEEYASTLGPLLLFEGTTADEETARERLRHGMVDVVVVVPPDAYETIRGSQQAVFTLYHNEISPLQADYVRAFGQLYVNAVNRRILQDLARRGQERTAEMETEIEEARDNAAGLAEALAQGDEEAAARHRRELTENLSTLELIVGAGTQLLGQAQQLRGEEPPVDGRTALENIAALRDRIRGMDLQSEERERTEEEASRVQEELARLDEQLEDFQSISPEVLVSPFRSETRSIIPTSLEVSHSYAPGVVVLLLQHLSVSFAGLSIVQERRTGTMELFQVSPLAALELLIGKYLSYTLFAGLVTVGLTALSLYVLRVPMLGSWRGYAAVLAALTFASLGIGFVISLLARTTSQAVQYAMIALLATVFFSGFFMDLDLLRPGVRLISRAVPATYGIQMLQNVMLRGQTPSLTPILSLTGLGVAFLIVDWLLLRRTMAKE